MEYLRVEVGGFWWHLPFEWRELTPGDGALIRTHCVQSFSCWTLSDGQTLRVDRPTLAAALGALIRRSASAAPGGGPPPAADVRPAGGADPVCEEWLSLEVLRGEFARPSPLPLWWAGLPTGEALLVVLGSRPHVELHDRTGGMVRYDGVPSTALVRSLQALVGTAGRRVVPPAADVFRAATIPLPGEST